MGVLAPAFFAGLAAIAIPILVHLIHRERKETVAFPSLMFLRKVPYRSVRRQKLRHLLLLALRVLAIALVVFAFSRPFLDRPVAPSAGAPDGREVVLLLDRSFSMGYGSRWDRAIATARAIASEARATDRISLVTFGATASQLTDPSGGAERVRSVLSTLQPTSEPTRFAAGFRMAGQILSASDLPRKEIVLISDFHRFGWTPNDEVTLPPRATVRSVDVSRGETEDMAITGVAVARRQDGSRVRAAVTARATNLGQRARTVNATLELAGRTVETKTVTVLPRATAQVVFTAMPVAAAPTRAVVRLAPDSQPMNDAFFFTVAEESGASAIIVEPPRPRANQSLYLSRALAVADDPPVRVDLTSALPAAGVRGRSLIVLNEADLPGGAAGEAIRARVTEGAILLVVPGERGMVGLTPAWTDALPARVGAMTDRAEGGRWASVDFSSALFEPFAVGRADFSSVTVTRYRQLTPATANAQIIARLDDGSPLLIDRPYGDGRIMVFALSLDAHWTDLPFHPLWVPLMHQLARRSIAGSEARSWFTLPHVLDLSREGTVTVESPSGARTRVAQDSTRPMVELLERGFYEIRGGGTALGAGRPVAVNVDLAESDLSHFDPAELVAAITARGQRGAVASEPAEFTGTAQELERRQAIWWYLLLAALILLGAETLLANRLSRRPVEQPATGVT
ncbi:MAG: BatA domain-containing protein [Gemmatimonadaceae bacterium]